MLPLVTGPRGTPWHAVAPRCVATKGTRAMKMDVLVTLPAEDGEGGREVGALVVRRHPAGGVTMELGGADGPPLVRFHLASAEATRLCSALESVVNGGDEELLIGGE